MLSVQQRAEFSTLHWACRPKNALILEILIMTTDNPLLLGVMARRSPNARFLQAPGPDEAALRLILEAGAQAPDHGRLAPFRFVKIAEQARGKLGEIMEAASLALKPDLAAPELIRIREKAEQAPVLIGLIGRIDPDHPKITASDQWLCIGCVLENLLLAAQSLGFGCAIRSGAYLGAEPMRGAFRLAQNEHLVAFLAVGTPADWPPAKPKPALEQVFSVWEG
jgi:nitroreductase